MHNGTARGKGINGTAARGADHHGLVIGQFNSERSWKGARGLENVDGDHLDAIRGRAIEPTAPASGAIGRQCHGIANVLTTAANQALIKVGALGNVATLIKLALNQVDAGHPGHHPHRKMHVSVVQRARENTMYGGMVYFSLLIHKSANSS